MDRSAPLAGRLRSGRLIMLSLVAVLAVGACGSSAAGGAGSGGGGQGDADKIIAETQLIFGTTMVSGEVQGDTIVITLRNGTSTAMANLFMCSRLDTVRVKSDPGGTLKMTAVDESGAELASSAGCK